MGTSFKAKILSFWESPALAAGELGIILSKTDGNMGEKGINSPDSNICFPKFSGIDKRSVLPSKCLTVTVCTDLKNKSLLISRTLSRDFPSTVMIWSPG